MLRLILSTWLCLLLEAVPAAAQFGNIFDPPRPPGEVPGRQPARLPPPQYQPAPQPPAPQLPAAQSGQSPYTSPQPGAIQSQPLPPLPGTEPTNPQQALQRPPPPGQPLLPGQPPGQRPPPGSANAAPQPGDEVVTELPSQKIPNTTAVFSGLDKITGRIIKFDVAINETVQFGALQVTPRACYTRPPTETPNTDAFVEVQEITLQGEVRRIFGGWMFAASPGLHAVEHPVYDVWLTDCKGAAAPTVAAVPDPRPAAIPAVPARPQQGTPRR
jgi:hypothetical protein